MHMAKCERCKKPVAYYYRFCKKCYAQNKKFFQKSGEW